MYSKLLYILQCAKRLKHLGISFKRKRCPTFVNLKTSLEAVFVFTEFPYFHPFNYEPSPLRCFLRNNSSVGEINLMSCQVMVIRPPAILFLWIRVTSFCVSFCTNLHVLDSYFEGSIRLTHICLRALSVWDFDLLHTFCSWVLLCFCSVSCYGIASVLFLHL